jgi:formate dehydrogenase iron-sulfur subunit
MSGKETIYVPLDSLAVALGADDVAAALLKSGFKIVRTGSRGMHWLEPLIEIEREGTRHGFGPVELDDVAALTATVGGADKTALTKHPKWLGAINDIGFFKSQLRLTFERCGAVDPVDPEDYRRHGGAGGLAKALSMTGAAICEEVMSSGLRGRGGAGFPSGIKWKTVAGASAEQKYIVCNADEGDSGTFADRMIMEGDPFLLIEGMTIAGIATGATQGFIYLRSEYPVAARILDAAIKAAYGAGLLGANVCGSGKRFDLEVFVGAGAYICGEETSLLDSLEGKRGEVRAKPPLPALEGLFAKPTLVHNVLSFCAVPTILSKGADFYRTLGVGKSTGTMPFQLSGDVKYSGLYEAPFGLTLRNLVENIGGGTRSGRPLRAIQIGGPLGAYLPPSLFDTMIDYEAMLAIGAGVGHGGIVVYNDSVDMLEQARYAFEFCAEESCGKCTPCRIGAVRGVELMDRIAAGDNHAKDMETLHDLCELMVDGSLCAMGGMTPIPVESAVKHFPGDFTFPPGRRSMKAGSEKAS